MDTLGMLSRQSMMIVDAHVDAKVQLEEVRLPKHDDVYVPHYASYDVIFS